MIRVLIVDDSVAMRGLIAATLRRDPEIQIAGEAGDPIEARQAIKALEPDVITLDVEMPNMNGLEFLEKIMRLRPMPVVMVSSLTGRGAEATLDALMLGAVDCVAKPSVEDRASFDDLALKVKAAARARTQPRTPDVRDATPVDVRSGADGRVIAIGSSTGGVEALGAILSRFPPDCPPTVITQHMPAAFTRSFAERLNRLYAPVCEEARDGTLLEPGHVYLAPGGENHLRVVKNATNLRCRVRPGDRVNGHRPSVDVLFHSMAQALGEQGIGVILTGMGRDGAQGLLAMRQAGALTFGQNESTSVVYGMPKAAFEIGAVQRQAPLDRIAVEVLSAPAAQLAERR